VHSFEWSTGAGAGTTAALEKAIAPLALVDQLPEQNRNLKPSTPPGENGNPTAFPDTSIFNESWEDWRVKEEAQG